MSACMESALLSKIAEHAARVEAQRARWMQRLEAGELSAADVERFGQKANAALLALESLAKEVAP